MWEYSNSNDCALMGSICGNHGHDVINVLRLIRTRIFGTEKESSTGLGFESIVEATVMRSWTEILA
jgi:hypothetical protein